MSERGRETAPPASALEGASRTGAWASLREALALNWRVTFPLMFCLAVILLLAFLTFRHFLLTFTVAGSLALLLQPVNRRLTARLGGRRWLSATILVLVCLVAVLLPAMTYAGLLVQQAMDALAWVRPRLEPAEIEKLWSDTLPRRYPLIMSWIRQLTGGGSAMSILSNAIARVSSGANHMVQVTITALATAFIDLGLFVLMLFFLLRDGDDLREALRGISPLTRGQEVELTEHLTRTVKGVLMSMVVVPLCQGLVALPAFWAFGVPKPHLWSLMVVFAAVIPLVGSPLAWVPAGLYLLLSGSTGKGVGLLIYGAVVISGIDNVIKPIILKGAAQIHMMLAFLSILGGVYTFGPKGLIVGPVVLSLVLSAYRIYRYDVLRWRTLPPPRGAVPAGPESLPAEIAL
jgi:predicted PurR-regulated permease PerM